MWKIREFDLRCSAALCERAKQKLNQPRPTSRRSKLKGIDPVTPIRLRSTMSKFIRLSIAMSLGIFQKFISRRIEKER